MASTSPSQHLCSPMVGRTYQNPKTVQTEANPLGSWLRKAGALDTQTNSFHTLDEASGQGASLYGMCQVQDVQQEAVWNCSAGCCEPGCAFFRPFQLASDSSHWEFVHELLINQSICGGKKGPVFLLCHHTDVQNPSTFFVILLIWVFFFFSCQFS